MYDRFTPLLCAAVLFLTCIGGTARAQCADVPPNPKDDVEEAAFGSACAMNAAGTVALVSGPGFDLGDGVVRTFERINGDWVEGTALGAQQLLGENYGWGLAMSDDGSAAIITAPRESVFSPGFRLAAGGVYIFQRDPDTGAWSQVRKWNSPDPNTEYNFGASCDMSADGGTVVIGETNVLGSKQAGLPDAAYVATRVGGVWGEPIELIPSPAPPDTFQFGEQVRISDDATLIAVSAASPPAFTGQSGRVYIFELVGDTWTQTDMLERATADSFNSFGKAIGFDGHDLLASNPSEMTPASKFNPTPPICIYHRSGGAYPATPDEIMPYASGTPIAGGSSSGAIHSSPPTRGSTSFTLTGLFVTGATPRTRTGPGSSTPCSPPRHHRISDLRATAWPPHSPMTPRRSSSANRAGPPTSHRPGSGASTSPTASSRRASSRSRRAARS